MHPINGITIKKANNPIFEAERKIHKINTDDIKTSFADIFFK